jgi:hypothetical protein
MDVTNTNIELNHQRRRLELLTKIVLIRLGRDASDAAVAGLFETDRDDRLRWARKESNTILMSLRDAYVATEHPAYLDEAVSAVDEVKADILKDFERHL